MATARSDTTHLDQGMFPLVLPLNTTDMYYILDEDVSAYGTAMQLGGSNSQITIDLNGHTITYDTWADTSAAAFGLSATSTNDLYVTNGKFVQSTNVSSTFTGGELSRHPIKLDGGSVVVDGVDLEYRSAQTCGLWWNNAGSGEIHYMTIEDQGTVITIRDALYGGILLIAGANVNVHHNNLYGMRQCGISTAGMDNVNVYNNTVEIDSHSTNSFGIGFYGGKSKCEVFTCTDNYVYGGGAHPIGIAFVSDVSDGYIARNRVDISGPTRPNPLPAPDLGWCGAYASRMTWGARNLEFEDNVWEINFDGDAQFESGSVPCRGRALWLGSFQEHANITFEGDTARAYAASDTSRAWAVSISDTLVGEQESGITLTNCYIASEHTLVNSGNGYATGHGLVTFKDCEFHRLGSLDTFTSISSTLDGVASTGRFFSCDWNSPASFDSMSHNWDVGGQCDASDIIFYKGAKLTVKVESAAGNPIPSPYPSVAIYDNIATTLATGSVDAFGYFRASEPIYSYKVSNCSTYADPYYVSQWIYGPSSFKIDFHPFMVTATKNGVAASDTTSVFADDTLTVTMPDMPPEMNNLPDRTHQCGTYHEAATGATSQDGDGIMFSATGLPPGMIIDPGTGLISGTPFCNDVGYHEVTVRAAEDGPDSLSDQSSFTYLIYSDVSGVDCEHPPCDPSVDVGMYWAADLKAVRFTLEEASQVSIDVFDVAGKLVRNIVSREYPPGSHLAPWDLTNGEGRSVPRGLYFIRWKANRLEISRKVIVM